jgi:hypothetical protein
VRVLSGSRYFGCIGVAMPITHIIGLDGSDRLRSSSGRLTLTM